MLIFITELSPDSKSPLCFNYSYIMKERVKNKSCRHYNLGCHNKEKIKKYIQTLPLHLISFGLGTQIFLCSGVNY